MSNMLKSFIKTQNQVTHPNMPTQQTQQKHFDFLGLPPELRNLIYAFIGAQAEADVIFPIVKQPQRPGKPSKERKCRNRLAMLQVNQQIRSEAHQFFHGAVHGSIYWSRSHDHSERECADCGEFHRAATLVENESTFACRRHTMQQITHLDMHGCGGEQFLSDIVAERENSTGVNSEMQSTSSSGKAKGAHFVRYLRGEGTCSLAAAQLQRQIRRLPALLPNVESLTLHVEPYEAEGMRRRASDVAYHHKLLSVFPRLKKISISTKAGVQVVSELDPADVRVAFEERCAGLEEPGSKSESE